MLERTRLYLAFAASLLFVTVSASGQFRPSITVNCTRGDSLATVAANALPNLLINVKGACAGPISITSSGVQLNAVGAASINGGGKDAVTITGAQRVTLGGHRRDVAGGGAEPRIPAAQQHVGEARMERQAGHLAPQPGDAAGAVQSVELLQQFAPLRQGGGGRRIEPGQRGGVVHPPLGQFQRQGGEVGFEDFRGVVGDQPTLDFRVP